MDINDYIHTCQSAKTEIPAALQMEELFGDADHFITEYGFDYGPKVWNTEVYFGGRYTLTLQVEVEIDYRHNTLKQTGVPKFFLIGPDKIKRSSFGEADTASYRGDQRWLSEEEWTTVYEAHGDFSSIGLILNPDPVPGFDEFVQGARRPIVPISLTQ